MMKIDSRIAVIIINYGTAGLAVKAVESVLKNSTSRLSVEIHLVDNASPGNDAEELANAHTEHGWGHQVELYFESENHGFGRGINLVIQALAASEVPPEFVFLLNPDAKLENDAIDILARALEADKNAAAAGAGISFPDGSPAVACFRFPTLLREIVGAINFGPLDRLLPQARVALPPEWDGPVDWVAGASVLMRFDRLAEVGFFDPDFFLYFEEVELMRRLKRAGYATLYVPEAKVTHIAGAATQVASHDTRPKPCPAYVYESWRMYFQKAHGRGYALLTALLKLPAAWLGMGLSWLKGQRSSQPVRFTRDHWRHVIRPLLSGEDDVTEKPQIGSQNMNPANLGFWALVAEDYRIHDRQFFSQGFWTLFWHRFGNWRMSVRPRLLRAPLTLLYRIMAKLCEVVCGIFLPYTVIVGRRVKLEHFGGMILVAERIGDDVTIRQNTTFGIARKTKLEDRPTIGNRVDIGVGAVLINRITVGDDAVIGANAVVVKDVPAGAVVGGVPARVLKDG